MLLFLLLSLARFLMYNFWTVFYFAYFFFTPYFVVFLWHSSNPLANFHFYSLSLILPPSIHISSVSDILTWALDVCLTSHFCLEANRSFQKQDGVAARREAWGRSQDRWTGEVGKKSVLKQSCLRSITCCSIYIGTLHIRIWSRNRRIVEHSTWTSHHKADVVACPTLFLRMQQCSFSAFLKLRFLWLVLVPQRSTACLKH